MTAPGTVSVIGLGYIGLPTATILACHGVRVFGYDIEATTIEAINQGKLPFVEPDLAEHILKARQTGMLTAAGTIHEAEAYVIAVPTPLIPEKEQADLTAVHAAARAIATQARAGSLVILESTSPPGTTEMVGRWIVAERPDLAGSDGMPRLHLAHCPERVLPGQIMKELVDNDRIVGGVTPEAAHRSADLYRIFCRGEILVTDARTAEMTKLVENSFRDVNIAFANELSLICDSLGVDVWRLIELANHHPRVNILQPGPGVGGHCIAVDPYFIAQADPKNSTLIRTARTVNRTKSGWVIDKVSGEVADREAPVIAALGLAFKANIDDLRESPAVEIVAALADRFPQGAIRAVEPHIEALPPVLAQRPNVTLDTIEDAVNDADAVVLLVDHELFRAIPRLHANTKVVDTRGAWPSLSRAKARGLR